MKMIRHKAVWCFTDGWINFTNDNRLVDGDIIILEYIDEGLFSFRILGLSAIEKKIFGPFRFCLYENVVENVIPDLNELWLGSDGEDEDPMQENQDYGIGGLYESSREIEDPLQENQDGGIGDSYGHARGAEDPMQENPLHEDEDNTGGAVAHEEEVEDPLHDEDEDNNIGGEMGTHDMEVEEEDPVQENEDNVGVEEDEDEYEDYTGRGGKERQRRRDQWLGTEIFAAGLAPQPTNPYFVTQFKTVKRAELFVPRHLLKGHNLEFPVAMSVFDPSGRKYTVNRSRQWGNDIRKNYYSGGWRSLCLSNMVMPNDHCIVELVKEEGTGILEGRVSFVRANNNNNNNNL